MTKYIYSNRFPEYGNDENIAFTPGKRYEVLDEWGHSFGDKVYMVEVRDDNGMPRTPLIGIGCAYLDVGQWTVVTEGV